MSEHRRGIIAGARSIRLPQGIAGHMNKSMLVVGVFVLTSLMTVALALSNLEKRLEVNRAEALASPQVTRSADDLRYELALERADVRYRTAVVRCTGMVGSAKHTCVSDAENHFKALVQLAQRQRSYVEIEPKLLTQTEL